MVIHGISQAFQRSLAGVPISLTVWFLWSRFARPQPAAGAPPPPNPRDRQAGFWLAGAALFGPVAGVSCYQWARLELPSAVVVAVAATSTLWVIPLARWIENDQPGFRQVAGTILAVAGIAVLYLA